MPGERQTENEALREEVAALREEIRQLQNEVVRRGTKLNCANVALARANIAFEVTAQRQDELVLEVSHDLRTPLTSIVGAAENLLDGVTGPVEGAQREYLVMIRDQAERLNDAVNWLTNNLRPAC